MRKSHFHTNNRLSDNKLLIIELLNNIINIIPYRVLKRNTFFLLKIIGSIYRNKKCFKLAIKIERTEIDKI